MTVESGSSPASSVTVSGTANSGDSASPRSVNLAGQVGVDVIHRRRRHPIEHHAEAALRSAAAARKPHGTASA